MRRPDGCDGGGPTMAGVTKTMEENEGGLKKKKIATPEIMIGQFVFGTVCLAEAETTTGSGIFVWAGAFSVSWNTKGLELKWEKLVEDEMIGIMGFR